MFVIPYSNPGGAIPKTREEFNAQLGNYLNDNVSLLTGGLPELYNRYQALRNTQTNVSETGGSEIVPTVKQEKPATPVSINTPVGTFNPLPGGKLYRFLNNVDWNEIANILSSSDAEAARIAMQYLNLKAEFYARQDAQMTQQYERLSRRADDLNRMLPSLTGAEKQKALNELAIINDQVRAIDEKYFGIPLTRNPQSKPVPEQQKPSHSANVIEFFKIMSEAIPWAAQQIVKPFTSQDTRGGLPAIESLDEETKSRAESFM